MSNFYCQKICGEVDFSIEEWNKARQEYKTLTPMQQQFVDEADTSHIICKTQCDACLAIVVKQRKKTQELMKKQNDHRRF